MNRNRGLPSAQCLEDVLVRERRGKREKDTDAQFWAPCTRADGKTTFFMVRINCFTKFLRVLIEKDIPWKIVWTISWWFMWFQLEMSIHEEKIIRRTGSLILRWEGIISVFNDLNSGVGLFATVAFVGWIGICSFRLIGFKSITDNMCQEWDWRPSLCSALNYLPSHM